MITLIIVDCQNDFITGTMSVKGAKNSVEEIKKFIKNHRKDIEKIIFTLDWHPYNHMSFKKYGGQWPAHCVKHTPGAAAKSFFIIPAYRILVRILPNIFLNFLYYIFLYMVQKESYIRYKQNFVYFDILLNLILH